MKLPHRYIVAPVCILYFLLFVAIQDGKAIKRKSIKSDTTSVTNTNRPNIVLILADDLGYGDISAFNENCGWKTPNIDKLTEQGVKFTRAYTPSSVCSPTRYGILTGRYSWRSGLKEGVLLGFTKALIQKNRLTIAEMLKQKNYMTAAIGKWHLGWDWNFIGTPDDGWVNYSHEFSGKKIPYHNQPAIDFTKPIKNGPNDRGFTYSYGISGSMDMPPFVYVKNGMPTSIPRDTTVNYDPQQQWNYGPIGSDFSFVTALPHLTDKTVEFIDREANSGKPFFLYLPLTAPHAPFVPTDKFVGKSHVNVFGDFVLETDYQVGRVMDALRRNNILENTIVIFTSDNGPSRLQDFETLAKVGHDPSYIFRGLKTDIYDGGHRVPFIVKWPAKIQQGYECDVTVSTVDFMATFADLVDYSLPDSAAVDSYSFLPILLDKNYSKPFRPATVLTSFGGRFAIIKDGWKLILWPGSGGWSYPRGEEQWKELPYFQLYNLKNDPSEKINVVYLYPEKVKELKSLLAKYVEEGRSTPGKPQKNTGPEWWPQLEWMKH